MASSKTRSEIEVGPLLRQIPPVDELLGRESLREVEKRVGRRLLVEATRKTIQSLRTRISSGAIFDISIASLEKEIIAAAESSAEFSLRPVINASGVVLHTNLGRAPLAAKAVERLAETAGVYTNLEYNLDEGERGKRDEHTDRLFARLLGAEMTLVVNNNAAAVFLALNTLAEGGEVIVSRGELIEIGGAFRIPDICGKSGAVLREVGTTNRTRLSDYTDAINDRTRAILRVHPSNFRVVGFTERPELAEVVALAHEHHLPLVEDLGSGSLFDLTDFGIYDEPTVGPSLKAGVDVIAFSGDKLLGGPQAGILTGRREPLLKIRRNPLFRALRVDKLTIAALEATVAIYLRGDLNEIPIVHMIQIAPEELARRAAHLAERITENPGMKVQVQEGESVVGGGSTPGQSLPTSLVCVSHPKLSAQALESELRRNEPPIIARIEGDRLVMDLRTVLANQEEQIVEALRAIAGKFGDAAAGNVART
ncbi:MAG TPA: L-seryl-tRNA(Sec) selenium transferase [Terriglobia bacterium]|nr:L-seryl-tRNA(Sec) selenium transferase [Terriglobia bacterium]